MNASSALPSMSLGSRDKSHDDDHGDLNKSKRNGVLETTKSKILLKLSTSPSSKKSSKSLDNASAFAAATAFGQLSSPSALAGVAHLAVKLRRKATRARKRVQERRQSLIPMYTPPPVIPVKYTERPERIWRRMKYLEQDRPQSASLRLAQFSGRPKATAYPEFDGKVQLPPILLSSTTSYRGPEDRAVPDAFHRPKDTNSHMEGPLLCQQFDKGLFTWVHVFVDVKVPIIFLSSMDQATIPSPQASSDGKVLLPQKVIHVVDIDSTYNSQCQVIGWRDTMTELGDCGPRFCFTIKSCRDLGTGLPIITLACQNRELAYIWLNYIRRASRMEQWRKEEEEERSLRVRLNRCPAPPPPTRRGSFGWSSFSDIAYTIVDDVVNQNNRPTTRPTTVQNLVHSLGLILDEKWAGGPATVYTVEGRAAFHIQTWYRQCVAHIYVNGPHGLRRKSWAANVVQRSLRGWRIRRLLRRTEASAIVIQCHWRKYRTARRLLRAQREMERKLKRARAYFVNHTLMRSIRIWSAAVEQAKRARDICRRALNGVVEHKFSRWCSFVEFRHEVRREKLKQEEREKRRRAMFFVKKMLYRSAATAIEAWRSLVIRNQRARAMLVRHLQGELAHHFLAWVDLCQRMKKARQLCRHVLQGIIKVRFDDWRHFVIGWTRARLIQKTWRMYACYANILVLKRWMEFRKVCAFKIQTCWRVHIAWQTTWGAGGVFVRMCAARLIQTQFRGYVCRRWFQTYLHKIRLLQGRFRYWMHHRRSAAIWIQYQWRRYWTWKTTATYGATLFQSLVRRFFARLNLAVLKYDAENSYYSWQNSIVFRGVRSLPDRFGKLHRTLIIVHHDRGTFRIVFLDPRMESHPAELILSGMQLIDLAEERAEATSKGGGGMLIRHIHSVSSLAETILDLIIKVQGTITQQPEYILRPLIGAAYSLPQSLKSDSVSAYPLRSPRGAIRQLSVSTQIHFWDTVYEECARRRENALPTGDSVSQLPRMAGKTSAHLLKLVKAINQYCVEENEEIRLEIGQSILEMDLKILLFDQDAETSTEMGVDSAGAEVGYVITDDHANDVQRNEGKMLPLPKLQSSKVLLHSTLLAQLLTGVGRSPPDIFDRIEFRAGELLRIYGRREARAEAEWAQGKGLRPPSRKGLHTPQTPQQRQREEQRREVSWEGVFSQGVESASSRLRQKYWEHELEALFDELLADLDKTQEMELPFLNVRETLEKSLIAQEQLHRQAISVLIGGADEMNVWLQHAGSVQGTRDMIIRAQVSKFIEACQIRVATTLGSVLETDIDYGGVMPDIEDTHAWSLSCSHIAVLTGTIETLKQMEEHRQDLIMSAYTYIDDVVRPQIDDVLALRHRLVAAFFAKQRGSIREAELELVDKAYSLMNETMSRLKQLVNNCMITVEDMKTIIYEISPGFAEIVRRSEMVREDNITWYCSTSSTILSARDEYMEELRLKKEARLKADLDAAARGGKSVEAVLRERRNNEAASRIQRVYRSYLSRANKVNTGGVWTEIIYSSKVLVTSLATMLHALELDEDETYEANMIKQMEQRVFKLNEQVGMRNLGPSMKQAFVVDKRWPIVGAMLQRWQEEANLAALNDDDGNDSSDWDSDDDLGGFSDMSLSDIDSDGQQSEDDASEDSDGSSDDDSDIGDSVDGAREKAKAALARAENLPKDILQKLRVLWRAHLAKVQEERDRLAAIRAKKFIPRMTRKVKRTAFRAKQSLLNSPVTLFAKRKMAEAQKIVKAKLHDIEWYQKTKLAIALLGYNHFPQYFSIPEGVKEAAAIKIQTMVRGAQARQKYANMVEARDEALFDNMVQGAAVKIQTLFRYYKARKEMVELVRISYNKEWDDAAEKWCYHNTVSDTYTYTKPAVLGDALDLPTPRSKARGMKWSANYYVEKQKKTTVVERKLVLTHTDLHFCANPSCNLYETKPNEFVQCRRCKVTYYCGTAHQMNDIDRHTEECDAICDRNRASRARRREAKKIGISEADMMTDEEMKLSETDQEERKRAELWKLEKLIDKLKKGLITQEEYTFALRELKL